LQETSSIKGDVEVSIDRLDPRLRLALCDQPLEGFWPKGARKMGSVSVGVRCNGSNTWSIYTRAKVAVFESVVVANRPLSRGESLDASDVELVREDLTRLSSGFYSQIEDVVGMEVRRPVRAGTVLGRGMVKAPILIHRGEKVSITASTGTVTVRMEGKALASGAKGDVITVMNLSSKHKIEATVAAPGVVKVRM
jgi:flagella basal body P-ring formation protein FlgA